MLDYTLIPHYTYLRDALFSNLYYIIKRVGVRMEYDFETKRQQLLESLRQAGIYDERVLAALDSTPREVFVDEANYVQAYENRALPINMGQSISQPLMVATMTQALHLSGTERVLEIGTGSGYQTAILAHIAAHVYSVERIQLLACEALKRVSKLGLENVTLYIGDGSLGWQEQAPYDRILVTAAAPEVPGRLFAQLVPWGMMVIPVGRQNHQELLVVHRAPWGPEIRSLGGCLFVPLVGEEGWQEV
ncbi:MAG: protein-L-isoaspartate(D-aspartate) O-methyltransferase [Ktedonobacteraceae bacterium]